MQNVWEAVKKWTKLVWQSESNLFFLERKEPEISISRQSVTGLLFLKIKLCHPPLIEATERIHCKLLFPHFLRSCNRSTWWCSPSEETFCCEWNPFYYFNHFVFTGNRLWITSVSASKQLPVMIHSSKGLDVKDMMHSCRKRQQVPYWGVQQLIWTVNTGAMNAENEGEEWVWRDTVYEPEVMIQKSESKMPVKPSLTPDCGVDFYLSISCTHLQSLLHQQQPPCLLLVCCFTSRICEGIERNAWNFFRCSRESGFHFSCRIVCVALFSHSPIPLFSLRSFTRQVQQEERKKTFL